MSGILARIRAAVRRRHRDRCAWCGLPIFDYQDYSLQHRRARGAGGSSRPETNLAGNLVPVHGTGTTECHGYIETHRDEARARGFNLWQACPVPADVPIQIYDDEGRLIWVRLVDNDDASMVFVPEQEAVAVMVAAGYIRKEMVS